MATKKEVKNPRKPATKKSVNTKKENNKTVETPKVQVTEDNNFDEYKVNENEFVLTKADDETELDFYEKINEEDQIVVKEESEDLECFYGEDDSSDLDEEVDPQEVINDFTEAAQKLDMLVISENPTDALQHELKKAEEIQEKLEQDIKKKEENLYNPRKRITTWGGVTDGWSDY